MLDMMNWVVLMGLLDWKQLMCPTLRVRLITTFKVAVFVCIDLLLLSARVVWVLPIRLWKTNCY